MKALLVFSLFTFISGAIAAAPAAVKYSIGADFGQTDNALRNASAASSSFYQLNPSVKVQKELTDNDFLFLNIKASVKDFTEQEVSEFTGAQSVNLSTKWIRFIGDNLETGASLGFGFSDTKDIESYQVDDGGGGTLQVDDMLNRTYSEFFASPYLAYLTDESTSKLSLKAKDRSYSTDERYKFDQANSKRFKDSHTELGLVASYKYDFNNSLAAQLSAEMAQKEYSERNARFTDGNEVTDAQTNPLLEVVTQKLALKIDSKISNIKLKTEVSVSQDDDRVLGALDSNSVSLSQSANLRPFRKIPLTLLPKVAWSQTQFDHYRSDFDAPQSSDLRLDKDLKLSLAVNYSPKKNQTFNLKLTNQKLDSNDLAEKFDENALTTGMTLTF